MPELPREWWESKLNNIILCKHFYELDNYQMCNRGKGCSYAHSLRELQRPRYHTCVTDYPKAGGQLSKLMAQVLNQMCVVVKARHDTLENREKAVRELVPEEWYDDPAIWRQFLGILRMNGLYQPPPPVPPAGTHSTPAGTHSTAASAPPVPPPTPLPAPQYRRPRYLDNDRVQQHTGSTSHRSHQYQHPRSQRHNDSG